MVEDDARGAEFWNFALSVYAYEAQRNVFLRLQDEYGLDVPMLLWCLWQGSQGIVVSRGVMAQARDFSLDWRTKHVEPLRALRRAWKDETGGKAGPLEDARQAVARAEQAVERTQMMTLASLPCGNAADRSQDASAANIELYCELNAATALAEEQRILLRQLVPPEWP